MQLHYTKLSHFSRKVRVLLDLYSIECELWDVGNVAGMDGQRFAGNPLMKIPVLVDGDNWLVDSDVICRYLVQKFDANDTYAVLAEEVFSQNARAIMNGVMSEEVKLVLAERTGIPTAEYEFFHKAKLSIQKGLGWIESNVQHFDALHPKFSEIHFMCMWQHLEHYNQTPMNFPQSASLVSELQMSPISQVLAATAPAASHS